VPAGVVVPARGSTGRLVPTRLPAALQPANPVPTARLVAAPAVAVRRPDRPGGSAAWWDPDDAVRTRHLRWVVRLGRLVRRG
jgi:hypothetical protein